MHNASREGYQTQNVHHTLRDHQNNFSMSYIEVKPSVKARHSVKLIPLPKSRVPDMQDSEMAKDIIREYHRTQRMASESNKRAYRTRDKSHASLTGAIETIGRWNNAQDSYNRAIELRYQ